MPDHLSIADLRGDWLVQDGSIERVVTLDCEGVGDYTWQDGTIRTTRLEGHSWHGTWHQAGNDREGAFHVQLTKDGSRAEGRWWYTRIGNEPRPSRDDGGTFTLQRMDKTQAANHPTRTACASTYDTETSGQPVSSSYP